MPRISKTEQITMKELKNQPISVVKAELPALAKALGVTPESLLKAIGGRAGPAYDDCRCCGNDSW